ncbi:Acetylajmalan esterase, partial [Bienertia sinuspersici]
SLFAHQFTILNIYWHLVDATNFFTLTFLNPYLKKDGSFSHGANFAVVGANALNRSTLAKKSIGYCPTGSSLLSQLDWFKSRIHSICSNESVPHYYFLHVIYKYIYIKVIDLGAIQTVVLGNFPVGCMAI